MSSIPKLTITTPILAPFGPSCTWLIKFVTNSTTSGFHITLPLASIWPNSGEASMTIMMSEVSGFICAGNKQPGKSLMVS